MFEPEGDLIDRRIIRKRKGEDLTLKDLRTHSKL